MARALPLCHRQFPNAQSCIGSGCALWRRETHSVTVVEPGKPDRITVPSEGRCTDLGAYGPFIDPWPDPVEVELVLKEGA